MKDNTDKNKLIRQWLAQRHVGEKYDPQIHTPEIPTFKTLHLPFVSVRERRLPHWELMGSAYFLTFRVQFERGKPFLPGIWHEIAKNTDRPNSAGLRRGRLESLPHEEMASLELPLIIEATLFYWHEEKYLLNTYVIMPDHVHIILIPFKDHPLPDICQSIKGFSAKRINTTLGRKGAFWLDESFDHILRHHDAWSDTFEYIHENPVRARLVENPNEYPFSGLVTMHSVGRMESFPK